MIRSRIGLGLGLYSPRTWLALGEWMVMLIAGIPAATPPPPPPCSYARNRSWFSDDGKVYDHVDGGPPIIGGRGGGYMVIVQVDRNSIQQETDIERHKYYGCGLNIMDVLSTFSCSRYKYICMW